MNTLNKIVLTHKNTKNVLNLIRFSSTSNLMDHKWKMAVKNGEKVIGYPTSFMNLRWLLTDEISNIATYMPKLIGTKHPMLEVSRDLLQQTDTAKWGLIVLLVSKAAGVMPGSIHTGLDEITGIDSSHHFGKKYNNELLGDTLTMLSGILHSQRSLAEITEMIKTGHQMHNTMVNLNQTTENSEKLHFGNKLALLSGDYLYSKSFKELALLNNNDLNEIIATSLRDLSQAEFIQLRDEYNRLVPCKPNQKNPINELFELNPYNRNRYLIAPRDEWMLRNIIGGVSLLAKSCQGALILGGHSEEFQDIGFSLGRNLGLAWQCAEDIKPFIYNTELPFSLTSAPVLFQLHEDPDMFELLEGANPKYSEIRVRVIQGEGLSDALDLLKRLTREAMNILEYFPTNDAQYSLIQMVDALSVR